MVASVAPASSTALRAICAEVTTWRPISAIDDDNSSVPDGHRLHVDRGFLGGGRHRAHQRAGLIGGRRHALRRGLHRIGRSSAGCPARRGRWLRIRRSGPPCGWRVRPWRCGPCPDRRRARGPRSCFRGRPAANSPSPRSRRAGWSDRFPIRGRRRTKAASSAAGCRSGAGCCGRHRARRTATDPTRVERAERQHDHGRKGNLAARLPGRGVGLGLHAVDQLLHADAETDIELAGFIENDLAVVDGVEFLLANLEDAGLALAQRQQFQRRVARAPWSRSSWAAGRGSI